MNTQNSILIWPIAVYGGLVVLLVAFMVVASHLLGQRHTAPGRDVPYESGMQPTGSARLRWGIRYYLVAIFFILFDIEAAIIFAWAIAFYELGWQGYIEAALFIVTLALGLVYIWKLGGLDWYPTARRYRGEE
jgi:NADH-quinone oxidoreductase subunit A